MRRKYVLGLLAILAFTITSIAQKSDSTTHHKFVHNGRFYGSWGYNSEWYTHSNISVNQPGMQNNYTFENLRAHDRVGWNNLFHVQPTIPQYNYRIGYFFDEKQLWGIEINFDHTKYVVTQGSLAIVDGTYKGHKVDTAVQINSNTLFWQLNNGANWFLVNIVRKFPIIKTSDNKVVIYALLKGGFGPNVPHVDDVIFGDQNHPHFQVGGVNTGVEALVRITFFQYAFIEYCNKVDYADYWGLRVYGGTASQSFGAYEMIANIGFTFHTKKTEGTYTAR
jgi:hypothetical protein